MLTKLRSSCLTPKHAQLLHLQPLTELAASKAGINPPWAGFQIPYFEPSGKLTKDFFRYRFWPVSAPSSGWGSLAEPSKLKYVQPENSELHVYLPPLLRDGATWADVAAAADCPLQITEGELKAACVCANTSYIMLGLGGVFSWMSKKRGQSLIPPLRAFAWRGRKVYLVFDSDRNNNPLVQLALSRLALTLLDEGAELYDVVLPAPASSDAAKATEPSKLPKQGVDDYILAHGVESYDALVEKAEGVQASAELHRFNDEVAFIWGGAGAGNVVRCGDGQLITPSQLVHGYYSNRRYMDFKLAVNGEGGTYKVKRTAEEWLAWPCRTRVSSLTYAPGQEQITAAGEFNLWRPTGVKPTKGSIAPWLELIDRLFPNAGPCAVEASHVLWFKQWLAYPLRYPGTKLFTCALLWSHAGGTGKNLLAETMIPIYGSSNCTIINSRHLTGDFNGWAEGRQFIIGDEITLDDKRHTSGNLKSMLTSRTVRINRKGIEAYEVPDCCNYYFTSNDPVSIMLEQEERRTFVHHVPETPIGDAYGRRYAAWLRPRAEGGGDGAAAVAYHLLHELSLDCFSPTAPPPDTGAKLELIANSRSDVDTWAVVLRQDPASILSAAAGAPRYAPHGPSGKPSATAPPPYYTVYTPADLLKIYDPDDKRRVSLRALGIALDRAGFRKATHNNGRLGNLRATFWLIGTDKPMTSSEAAHVYRAERPEPFTPPSARSAGFNSTPSPASKEKVQ